MKILTLYVVLNFLFFTEFFEGVNAGTNSTAATTTTPRPAFVRSRFAKKKTNGINIDTTTNSTEITLNTTLPPTTVNTAPSANITTNLSAPVILNETTTSVPLQNKTLNQTTPISIKPPNLSYDGCGIRRNENHPWIAILEHTPAKFLDSSKLRIRKTLSKGVLIHPGYVLTTISSMHNSHPFWIVSSVRLGDKITLDISDRNSTQLLQNPVKVSIEEVFLHRHKDIAILKLSHNVNVTDFVRPICLPTDNSYNYRELFSHFCRYRSYHRQPRERRVTTEPVSPISPQDCRILFTRKQSEISIENEFCAWDETGDTCAGDVGGPLFIELDEKNTLIGLRSMAMANSNSEELQLDSTMPGVYTRVGSYLKWIAAVINSQL